MRESTKITVKYQFLRILLMQAAASGVAFVFCSIAFWYFTNINIAKQILSVIFIGVNFAFLYTAAKKFAILDGKPYTPLKQNKLKGVLFGCAVAALNIVFMVIFSILWKIFGDEFGITGVLPTAYNAFFVLWTYPYNGIMNLTISGYYTWYSAAAMVLAPIAATAAGYIAGCRKFDLTEQLDKLMYEKED